MTRDPPQSRSRDTLAIASSDAVSMDDSSMATLEDFPSLPDAEAFRNQERVIDKIVSQNWKLVSRSDSILFPCANLFTGLFYGDENYPRLFSD